MNMATLQVVVEALKALISFPEASKAESIGKRVKCNVTFYKNFLKNPSFIKLVPALERRKETMLSVAELELNTDLLWYRQFCCEAMALLGELDNSISQLNIVSHDISSQVESKMSPVSLLSVAEQKVIRNVMEFLVCLGIYPHLFPGADTVLRLRLKCAEEVVKAVDESRSVRDGQLYETCDVISRCFTNKEIGPMLALRHLSDIFVALIQIIYAPNNASSLETMDPTLDSDIGRASKITGPSDVDLVLPLSGTDTSVREKSKTLCEQVLQWTYQPLVIQQLLMLQGPSSASAKKSSGTPHWLIKACGHYLSERLMTKNGVMHVINGIMEATSGTGQAMPEGAVWRKCKAVAAVLATPPSTVSSLDHYYSVISPQILSLLQSHSVSEEHVRIATLTLSVMLKKSSADNHLLYPLLLPLNQLVDNTLSDDTMDALVQKVQECMNTLHKMSKFSEPSSELLSSLLPYSSVLFGLWRVLPDCHNMSIQCKEVLGQILLSASNADVLHFLCAVSGLPNKSREFIEFDTSLSISLSGNPPQLTISRLTGPQNLDLMEATGKLVIELLQNTLETRALSREFFVKCMKCLTSIISKDVKLNSDAVTSTSSSALLECEQIIPKSQTEHLRDSQILYVTSTLCENLSDIILKDLEISDLADVFRTIFECHAKSVREVQLVPSKKVNEEITGGPVSLSICCGLISALLSGSRTVKVADRPKLTSLRPSLDKIAAGYPDPELRAVAGDISVCIGTLGAVWSAEIDNFAELKSVTEKVTSHIKDKLSPNQENNKESSGQLQCSENSASPYCCAVQDLKDSLIAVRANGIIRLTKLINTKDKETLCNVPFLIDQFHQNLRHSDSYIYLAAINALVSLAQSTPQNCSEKVLRTLCQEYANLSDRPDRSLRKIYDEDTGQLKASQTSSSLSHGIEIRMKMGEALVKIYHELSEMLPHYCEDIVASLLTTVKDKEPLLRASSLSNIAEIFKLSQTVVDLFLIEVLSCVDHILRSDQEACVRQAALVVLKNIIVGANDAIIMKKSDKFLGIYRLLKTVEASEQDELTKVHAQAALGELDTAMRAFIFNSERKLEKKITVLSDF